MSLNQKVVSLVLLCSAQFWCLTLNRLYYTKLRLGSPPRDFYVQVDTGSDVLWVSCASCNGCPQTSGLQVKASENFF